MDTLAEKPPATARVDVIDASLERALAGMRPGWIVLRDCILAVGDSLPAARVPYALIHPDIGVALLDLLPGPTTPDAVDRLRRMLADAGEVQPGGYLPIVHICMPARMLPGLGELLDQDFARQLPLVPPQGGDWVAVVRRALNPQRSVQALSLPAPALRTAPEEGRTARVASPRFGVRVLAGFWGTIALTIGGGALVLQYLGPPEKPTVSEDSRTPNLTGRETASLASVRMPEPKPAADRRAPESSPTVPAAAPGPMEPARSVAMVPSEPLASEGTAAGSSVLSAPAQESAPAAAPASDPGATIAEAATSTSASQSDPGGASAPAATETSTEPPHREAASLPAIPESAATASAQEAPAVTATPALSSDIVAGVLPPVQPAIGAVAANTPPDTPEPSSRADATAGVSSILPPFVPFQPPPQPSVAEARNSALLSPGPGEAASSNAPLAELEALDTVAAGQAPGHSAAGASPRPSESAPGVVATMAGPPQNTSPAQAAERDSASPAMPREPPAAELVPPADSGSRDAVQDAPAAAAPQDVAAASEAPGEGGVPSAIAAPLPPLGKPSADPGSAPAIQGSIPKSITGAVPTEPSPSPASLAAEAPGTGVVPEQAERREPAPGPQPTEATPPQDARSASARTDAAPMETPPSAPVSSTLRVPAPTVAPVQATEPAGPAQPPLAAADQRSAATSTEPPRPRATPAVSSSLSPGLLQALIRRGDEMLALGDISAARLLYERAANAGSGPGALAAGRTYDPAVLAAIGAREIRPDPAAAAAWYRRAIELGHVDANALLRRLEGRARE